MIRVCICAAIKCVSLNRAAEVPVMGGGGEVLLKVPSGREVGGPLNKKTMHLRKAL